MEFDLWYHEDVKKRDIPQLSSSWKKRIQVTIEQKLIKQPEIFGKPLRKSLKGYRKLRIGEYRVIYGIENKKVKIFIIQHRKVVYRTVLKRTIS
ncbi:addiction module antitoxin RelB [Candidatus Wolfebacteria bacterium]|nr:MAG: addiction module antitoxin RelB [Candidatus Wolfebacteria bacterium]